MESIDEYLRHSYEQQSSRTESRNAKGQAASHHLASYQQVTPAIHELSVREPSPSFSKDEDVEHNKSIIIIADTS